MINSATTPILAAAVVQSALGLTVFFANPRRKSNQCLLLLSVLALGWLATLYYGFAATKLTTATACMREAFAAGALVLAGFNLLRLSIRYHTQNWSGILRRSRIWLIGTAGIIGLCQTKFFLEGARLPSDIGNAAPQPIYGPAAPIYAAYFVAAIAILIISAARDIKQTKGGQRTELAFILVGGVATLAVSLLLSLVLRFFVDQLHLLWFGVLFRRLISYGLLSTYLLALYILVWWLAATALRSSVSNGHSIAHVMAAIVVAFAMAPARGISQRLAERLFIGSHQLDFRATVSKAAKILSSVTTLRDLLDRFANTVAGAVGTDRVFILLQDKQGFSQQYPMAELGSRQRLELTRDQATIAQLESSREPIVMDELHRARPTPQLQRVMRQLDSLQIVLAMGIFARDQLAGVLLLGPRRSGRIYGSVEQSALQVLCGQLAVAIENAELFTEVQNAKIYNETLLENLTSGVIAAGIDERITVFNNEAGLITGLNSEEMLDRSLDNLPNQLGAPLRDTLRTGESQESGEIGLRVGNQDLIVRTSTQIFHGEDGKMLGALMVLTDITAIKRLELQIRRSDRLASLGTLSAGMAHEIKNPLVSIKTFAQLLPERYQDSDFRETFSNLIGHEIDRIDSLVNQLLRFARPTKPILKQLHAHEVLEKSLLLIGHRLYQKQIKLTRSWEADVDTIRADSDQLEQVFLNFFLNAIDAMKNGGELIVSTQIRNDEAWLSNLSQSNGETREALRITIRDNGEGIRSEDIPHVFDPFFSTKDYGTGLGLSVVHGIIQEHGGQVEVESELKKGTAFHILLPLVRLESQVVAA